MSNRLTKRQAAGVITGQVARQKHASCKEHSCSRVKATKDGYCEKHRFPWDRHHDRKAVANG